MRKLIAVSMAVMLVLGLSLMPVYAAVPDDGGVISPMWNSVSNANARLSISSSGTATCNVTVISKATNGPDSINAWVQLNDGSGIIEKGWQCTLTKSGTTFTFSDSYHLTERGNYYLDVTLYCYKNGALVETVTCESATVRY